MPKPDSANRLELLGLLRQLLPHWALGLDEPKLAAGMAARVLMAERPLEPLAVAARGLAWWTWQKQPLSQDCIRLLASSGTGPGSAPEPVQTMAAHLAALPEVAQETTDPILDAVRDKAHADLVKHVFPFLAKPGLGPALLGRILPALETGGGPDLHKAAVQACALPPALEPLRQAALARWAMLHLPPAEAEPHVRALDQTLFPWWRDYLLAELALRQNGPDQAIALLTALLRLVPWHANLTLKLHALAHPVPRATDTSGTAVLLYSYNKTALLESTLENLLDTNLGRARVFVLDNASTDGTGDMLDAVADAHPGRLTVVKMPTNIGAPGARNWLLALPEVQACSHAAFVDDDVVLPPDWLTHLLGHAQNLDAQAAVGLRITSADDPAALQSADYNIIPPRPETANTVPVHDNCAGTPDLGLYSYTRPCASVSGCCHLINMDSVRQIGGFDIRYSPTQFDDLDRDLTCLLANRPALYAGTLPIRHIQFSSLAKATTTTQIANIMGNRIKLNAKFDAQTMAQAAKINHDSLWQDLKAKVKAQC